LGEIMDKVSEENAPNFMARSEWQKNRACLSNDMELAFAARGA